MHLTILRKLVRRLARDRRGVAHLEFALAAPLVVLLGLGGLEAANLALAQLRISQISSNLADTASRIGDTNGMSLKQIREADINDAFEGARLQMASTPVASRGRIILSSLEQNSAGGQFIRWQRCLGLAQYNSDYAAGVGVTGTSFPGIGPSGEEIQAPPGSAVMFAEVIYRYQPVVTDAFFGEPVLKAKAAFLVRDRRDLSAANNPGNPSPAAAPMTCDRYTE